VILLDTDHINVLQSREPRAVTLMANMVASADQDFATTVITIEEQMRGWLAVIHRSIDVHRQLPAYERLVGLVDFFSRWRVARFSEAAVAEFTQLRQRRVRIGAMDLKIASIALANGALLLSANLRDFQQVPNPRVENWLV
jgi:tRNA(fMet)-specific endonuclease VapC